MVDRIKVNHCNVSALTSDIYTGQGIFTLSLYISIVKPADLICVQSNFILLIDFCIDALLTPGSVKSIVHLLYFGQLALKSSVAFSTTSGVNLHVDLSLPLYQVVMEESMKLLKDSEIEISNFLQVHY